MPAEPLADPATDKITRASAVFRAIAICMTLAGLSTFALMNCVQPLMPLFTQAFNISPAQASLSLSINIGVLALLMPFASLVSERLGRKPVLVASLLSSGVICIASASADSWNTFLLYRALQGAAFSGVPAIAMAYIAEEIAASDAGYAAGVYVSGAAIGGMSGRVLAGFVADAWGWRVSLIAIGLVGAASALAFTWLLPRSRHFTAQRTGRAALLASYRGHVRNPALRRAYVTAFLMMGSLVMVYNFLGFRLGQAPFNLSSTFVGSLFLTYLAGIYASTYAGKLADRHGARVVSRATLALCALGGLLMSTPWLALVVIGLIAFTVGYFATHAVANGSVSRHAGAGKSQASTLYFIAYYVGGAALGWAGGVVWLHFAWPGVTLVLMAAIGLTWQFGLSTQPQAR
ncbi:MFS transporter [Pseudomonas sp. HR96]|uniref:MFS transporter n=1 Tax=Pseudomonas sp. HR96 TaxID=1027966 RepID=UPI002A755E50|nr:MFS transporter [Pseudomonas sp. HR96]WPO97671.1 MFS transporter [Pseudomonas sp. HR96]